MIMLMIMLITGKKSKLNDHSHSEREPKKERMGNYLSMVFMVGRTFSFAERETKKEKGTNQRHIVKYAIT